MAVKKYKAIYLLPSSLEEQAVEEFAQKLEQEINQKGGAISSTNRMKQQMVKTTTNKGNRNVYTLISKFSLPADKIKEVTTYLRLAQGTVKNFMILNDDVIAQEN
ncbi:MAG: 30S ribosomal protein S6 [Candidatus Caenarcaniphilales bacterium]|nr:30S ribosomal protein S6 [Candidatus Caenarcaniphilales bacterium]